jgi:hypothetical protein
MESKVSELFYFDPIHTSIHTYTHTYIHTYIHTNTNGTQPKWWVPRTHVLPCLAGHSAESLTSSEKYFPFSNLIWLLLGQEPLSPFPTDKSVGTQGCQMVCFQTKNPNLGKFWWALEWKMSVNFTAIWSIFWPLGILCVHLIYFMVVWYIFHVLVCCIFGILYGHLVYFMAIW